MTANTQMTVRIPRELAEFVDAEVAEGAKSRAAVIARALLREKRRKLAQRDAEIYARTGPDPELDAWVESAAKTAWADLD